MRTRRRDGEWISQDLAAAQAAQFWERLQRAQTVALRAQSKAFATAAVQEFRSLSTAGVAAMKAFAEFAQHPMELAAFQQTVWLDAMKAWVDAWSGESPAVADKRFRDKTWEADPISAACAMRISPSKERSTSFSTPCPRGRRII